MPRQLLGYSPRQFDIVGVGWYINHMRPTFYQIFYKPDQRSALDPLAVPFNNEGHRSLLLEFDVFQRLAAETPAELWGAVSWKFTQKTGLTLADLQAQIARQPNADVYYCNPFPETEAFYHNLWLQGETCHPDFLALSRKFFVAAGLPETHLSMLLPSRFYSATNYFVGTPRFWQSYIEFIRRCLHQAEANMAPADWDRITSSEADMKQMHAGACYLPFIVERLFSVWLLTHQGFKAVKYAVRPVKQENGNVTVLRALKDRAAAEQSNLLGVSWANYRNLYLAELHGKSWARKYLPVVTPTKLVFPS